MLELEMSLVVLDSLVNGSIAMLEAVAQLASLARGKKPHLEASPEQCQPPLCSRGHSISR